MNNLQAKTDILLELSAPIPFKLAALVIFPFALIEHYVPIPSIKYIPITVGFVLSLGFIVIYSFMRASKNKLNNEYLEKCRIKNVDSYTRKFLYKPNYKRHDYSMQLYRIFLFILVIDTVYFYR
jgi:hypothetical protein